MREKGIKASSTGLEKVTDINGKTEWVYNLRAVIDSFKEGNESPTKEAIQAIRDARQ